MKKIIASIIITTMIIINLFCIADEPIQTTYSHLYGKTTIVTQIDYTNDIVYCDDFNGFTWSFFGTEDWNIDDIATFVMYDNNTADIHDDIIIKVTYNGYIE